MITLICGGRDYNGDMSCLEHLPKRPTVIIEGGAKGADRLARFYGVQNGIHVATVNAQWDTYGKAAGHKRNAAMLALKPDYCVAFPGGRGTQSMVDMCKKHGVPVWEPYPHTKK